MSDWQPIETAPKDQRVLLARPIGEGKWHMSAGKWQDQRYHKKPKPYWGSDMEFAYGIIWLRTNPPTHWKPLTPPAQKED